VQPNLLARNDPSIFALGDCATFMPEGADRPLPPTAQVANQQALHLIRHLPAWLQEGKALPSFRFRDFGALVALSDYNAFGTLGRFCFFTDASSGSVFARLSHALLYRRYQLALHGTARAAVLLGGRTNQRARAAEDPLDVTLSALAPDLRMLSCTAGHSGRLGWCVRPAVPRHDSVASQHPLLASWCTKSRRNADASPTTTCAFSTTLVSHHFTEVVMISRYALQVAAFGLFMGLAALPIARAAEPAPPPVKPAISEEAGSAVSRMGKALLAKELSFTATSGFT
jgi:hypothetical protein